MTSKYFKVKIFLLPSLKTVDGGNNRMQEKNANLNKHNLHQN